MLQSLVRRLRRRQPRFASRVDDVGPKAVATLFFYLFVIIVLHIAAMMTFEGLGIGDAAWLTATTVTTVGYGDMSAASGPGRLSTVLLVYVGGIFVLAKGAGDYFDYRAERHHRMITGRWSWNMADHLLLIHTPRRGAIRYFTTLVGQLRDTDWGGDRDVIIVTDQWADGLPSALRGQGVVHVDGRADDPEVLRAASAEQAAAIVVLVADLEDAAADSVAFDLVHRLSELGTEAPILVECVDDANGDRLREAGASSVLRPMRGYPEMMVRALVAPGSTEIITDIFTTEGDTCVRFECDLPGVAWRRVVETLMEGGYGTAIGYAARDDGKVVVNPGPNDSVHARGIFLIAKDGRESMTEALRETLAGLAA